ncbi:MAG: carbohydrate kinase family protein [Anaerolineae bacterium]|nr:carbohydrate kinase family protein [Anaerolineae bacterium]
MTVQYVSMGIILDDIVFPDGQTRWGVLGGGGPQTVWGMALAAQSGDQVGLLSGVGADFDPGWLAPLRAMAINLDGVHVTDLPTPRAWQLLDDDGSRRHVWRGMDQAGNDRQTHLDFATITRFYPALKVIQWGIHPEDAFLSISAPLQAHGVLIGIEPFKGTDEPLDDDALHAQLTGCALYSPTWSEAVEIFGVAERGPILDRCRALGGHILMLRMGAAGAEAWNVQTGAGVRVPAAPVRGVVDPVGAGDAFCGAFAVTWHETGDLAAAAISATVAASYLVEQVGVPPARPDPADLAARQQAVRAGLERLTR